MSVTRRNNIITDTYGAQLSGSRRVYKGQSRVSIGVRIGAE